MRPEGNELCKDTATRTTIPQDVRPLGSAVSRITGKLNAQLFFGDHQDADQGSDQGIKLIFFPQRTRFGEGGLVSTQFGYIEDSSRAEITPVSHAYGLFCRKADGSLQKTPEFFRDCPADSRYAIDLTLLQTQLDLQSDRRHDGIRWLDAGLKMNLIQSGNPAQPQRRLSAEAGASLETVWPGNNLQAQRDQLDYRRAPFTTARANLQLDGTWTSSSGKWTFNGAANFRPSFTALRDHEVALNVEGLRNFHLGHLPAAAGIRIDHTRWPYPQKSIDFDQSQGPLYEDDERFQLAARAGFHLYWW